jgi:GTP-binding protein HflX
MARSVTYIPTTLIDRTFREKIVLVGVQFPGVSEDELDYQLDELALLVDTAGADVVARVVQRRDSPDPATFLGSGKVQELREICLALDSDTVVFEYNLSPAQQRNLEKILGRTAIDRTAVILDIFAQNARTPEGRAQVELALLQYRLPRLRRAGGSLSQQAGGIGTRGPGETQLETDRRRLVNRIHAIRRELKEIDRTRTVQRQGRARGRHREVTLVGYTNAGKSSMLNAITDAGVDAEDRLFVTLDPRTRQRQLSGGETVLFTDTVGFISNLPHDLVEAFMSTLKSVQLADLLVHVVDGDNDHAEEQIAAVREVLREIDADHVPELLVFNKADVPGSRARELAKMHEGSVWVSAATHENLEAAIATIGDRLRVNDRAVTLHLPLDRGDLLARAHREGEVVDTSITEDSVVIRVLLDSVSVAHFDEWRVPA